CMQALEFPPFNF
nr:immunoglobulin light chain junction region [Macaca mulatta]